MKRLGIRLSIGITVLLLLLGLPASMQDNQTTVEWDPPYFVDYGWWQYPVLDLQGNLHLVWYSDTASDSLAYVRRDSNGVWTQPNDIECPCGTGFTVRNAITTTNDGRIQIVYRGHEDQFFSSAYYNNSTSAAEWSPPIQISTSSYYVDLLADKNDILHMVSGESRLNSKYDHSEDDPCLLCSDVIYRRSTDEGKTWSEPLNLSNTPDGSERMSISQGASGRLYVAWSEGFDGYHTAGQAKDVRFAYSDDEGLSWSQPIILEGGKVANEYPTNLVLTELHGGRILVVWRYAGNSDRNFYYQLSSDNGKTWTLPAAIPGFVARDFNTDKYDNPNLVIDKLGIAHFFAVGDLLATSLAYPFLFHVEFIQSGWLQPEVLFQSANESPEWPRAVIGAQNDIHLTWFTRVFGANREQLAEKGLKVYYSRLPGILPPAQETPGFRPTITLQPTPTLFRYIEATATPAATFAAYNVDFAIQTTDIYAIDILLGGVLVSGIFCAGLIILIRLWRR